MLTVHHLGVSQSERIVWLCEELEIPYELKRYARDPVTRLAPPDYKALHPLGTAPVITDGSLVLAESGAIIEYVIAKYGDGRLAVKPEAPNYADYLFWFHYANGSMMPNQFGELIAAMASVPAADNQLLALLAKRSQRGFDLMESRLANAEYFAGDELTAADIIMVFTLTTMRAFVPRDLAGYPAIGRYLKRIGARPAYRRAMEKGDPGMTPNLA
jgi:glutathione S-transferase